MLKLYALIIILAVLGMVGAGGYWYYDSTQAELVSLKTHNAALESAIETQKETMSQNTAHLIILALIALMIPLGVILGVLKHLASSFSLLNDRTALNMARINRIKRSWTIKQ